MRWGYSRGFTLGAGSNGIIIIRMNSLYDPEYATGTGQKSYGGFD